MTYGSGTAKTRQIHSMKRGEVITMAKSNKCKGCRRVLIDSYCWPESKSGWHYRYCPNTKGHCKYAAGAVRQ